MGFPQICFISSVFLSPHVLIFFWYILHDILSFGVFSVFYAFFSVFPQFYAFLCVSFIACLFLHFLNLYAISLHIQIIHCDFYALLTSYLIPGTFQINFPQFSYRHGIFKHLHRFFFYFLGKTASFCLFP